MANRGRPKMTDEEKAARKLAREAEAGTEAPKRERRSALAIMADNAIGLIALLEQHKEAAKGRHEADKLNELERLSHALLSVGSASRAIYEAIQENMLSLQKEAAMEAELEQLRIKNDELQAALEEANEKLRVTGNGAPRRGKMASVANDAA